MIQSIGRGGIASTSTAGMNYTVNPAAIPGDISVVGYCLRSTTATVNAPSGWVTRYSDVVNSNRLQVFSRFLTGFGSDNGGTEPTHQFANSAGTSLPYWACGWVVRGVDPTSPFLVAPTAVGGAGTTGVSLTAPGVTPLDSGGLALWYWMSYFASGTTSTVMTLPAGLTYNGTQVRASQTTGYNGILGGIYPTPYNADTGAKVASCSANGSWRGIGMVLRESRVRQPNHHLVLAG